MEQSKNIAIIHRDTDLVYALSNLASNLGYNPQVMVVNSKTTPGNVHAFVTEMMPDLVLLAENYQGGRIQTDPDTGDLRDVKVGEGIEALIELRDKGITTPVILISGNPRHKEDANRWGANGYLKIPVHYDEFEAFLKEHI